MDPQDSQYGPEEIDQYIESLIQSIQDGEAEDNLDARLVRNLQRYYETERKKEVVTQVWQRLDQRYEAMIYAISHEESDQELHKIVERIGQGKLEQRIIERSSASRFSSNMGIMVAVAIAILLIGSTALLLNFAAPDIYKGPPNTGGSHQIIPQSPTAMPVPNCGVDPTEIATAGMSPATVTAVASTPLPESGPSCVATPTPVAPSSIVPSSTPTPTAPQGTPTVLGR